MRTRQPLTTTSYALLGLLSLRPWTTYELAQEMRRSLRYMWPRAESGLYQEPKKLVREGLARATRDRVGRRPRTTYAITVEGRHALRHWLREPAGVPSTDFEGLLKILFADAGTKKDLLATLSIIGEQAESQRKALTRIADEIARGAGPFPFPKRAPVNYVTFRFLAAQSSSLIKWANAAQREVRRWPEQLDRVDDRLYRAKFAKVAKELGRYTRPP